MTRTLDTVLLLALPASGKSEVRRYLAHVSPAQCRDDFHMGPTVQLDDFPYVHLMRRIDDELVALGQPRIYFQSGDKPFHTARHWGTLIQLINEDYDDLHTRKTVKPASPAAHFFARLDAASTKVGGEAHMAKLDDIVRQKVSKALDKEAGEQLDEKQAAYAESREGKTVVIEFARGGPDKSTMPLGDFLGYRYSLAQLSPAILERSTILYVWVTPEESRRKNQARTDPNDPGSILHHGVPIDVMMNDYGVDDMDWLEETTEKKGTITVQAHQKTYHLPIGRFDNRVDKTSFLRAPQAEWNPADVKAIHDGLKSAFDRQAGK